LLNDNGIVGKKTSSLYNRNLAKIIRFATTCSKLLTIALASQSKANNSDAGSKNSNHFICNHLITIIMQIKNKKRHLKLIGKKLIVTYKRAKLYKRERLALVNI